MTLLLNGRDSVATWGTGYLVADPFWTEQEFSFHNVVCAHVRACRCSYNPEEVPSPHGAEVTGNCELPSEY